MSHTLLIVGHGMVGHRLVEQLRDQDREGHWRVVVVTDETRPAYNRILLSRYLRGDPADELDLIRPGSRHDPLVEYVRGTTVSDVDPWTRVASCTDGTRIEFDALVLATGSRPFVPPVPGRELDGCFVYRTLDDADAIRSAAVSGEPGVVIGGGLLGLEAADALRHLGMRPHVVEAAAHPMPRQVDAAGGALIAELLDAMGVTVHCGTTVRSLDPDEAGSVRGVTLADGRRIECRLVIFASGIRPRDELGRTAGLRPAERGGIPVDDRCRTGIPGIWAIGECAALNGRTYGLIEPGYRMAESVAGQLTGADPAPLVNVDTSTRLKLLGIDVASFGEPHAGLQDTVEFAQINNETGSYTKLVLSADGRILRGGVLVGDMRSYPTLSNLIGKELPAP